MSKDGIYVAGPMTKRPEFNFPAFFAAEDELVASNFKNIGNPARWDTDNGLDTTGMTGYETAEEMAEHGFDLAEALKMDLAWIADNAMGIALLDGWEGSKGVAAEVALGKALGLHVAPLAQWVGPLEVGERVDKPGCGTGTLIEFGVQYGGDCVVRWDESFGSGETDVPTRLSTLTRIEPKPGPVVKWREPARPTVADLHERLTEMAGTFAEVTALPGDEVRVTSETGGQKGRKSAELATVDPLALMELAKVSGFGARKYESFNYLKGYDWSLSHNALYRHLLEYLMGNDLDDESGLPHITHAAWHALALTSFHKRGIGTDDRVSAVLDNHKREENAA